jgi:cytochrome c-type biogenesis protein CcmH/NrfF
VLLVFVASFLAGSILTWAIPLAVVLVVGLYWGLVIRRHSDEL